VSEPATSSEIVFTGGRILTMDPTQPEPEAVAVRGGRILAVGQRAALLARDVHDPTSVVEVALAGRTLVPGFIDGHNHLSIAALNPRWRDAGAATDTPGVLAVVAAQATAEPEAAWVRVRGWAGPEVAPLSRRDLDGLDLGRPVVVAHASLHMAVVDSVALAELGIGRSTAQPAGGEIGHDPDGEPNGLLLERAWGTAHARSLAAYADPDRWAEHIAERARLLLAEGITAVHDAACSPEAEAVFRSMGAAGTLPLSVLVMPHPATLFSHDFGSRFDGPCTGEGDEVLRVGPAKLFADGGVAIGLDVAVSGHPIRSGILMDDLTPVAHGATERGWRLAVHAIGNVGVERCLDAFESVARRHSSLDHRFRVEHALVTSSDQWSRLGAVGAIGVVQPGFVEHVGTQSAGVRFDHHHWLAFAGLAAAGVTLAASSDDPCAPFPPLWCAHKGASRTTDAGLRLEPDQALPLQEWLRAYTAGAAFAGGQESERGSLTAGKRADLVLLRGPLDGSAPPTVSETWVAGAKVFEARP
jgi:hypothetical protein